MPLPESNEVVQTRFMNTVAMLSRAVWDAQRACADNERLLGTLKRLRDLGNTVVVVEHDEDAILQADYVVDVGPGAGIHGGEIVAEGTPAEIMANPASLTGKYLTGEMAVKVPAKRRKPVKSRMLRLVGARGTNLKNITAEIPAPPPPKETSAQATSRAPR